MIKRIIKQIALVASLSVASAASASTAILLRADDGLEKVELSAIKNFVVSTNNQKIVVYKTDGRYKSNVSTLLFNKNVNVENYNSDEDGIVVYPNPVSSFLFVDGTDDSPNVVVYDVNGEEVIKTREKKVDVSSLKSGLYVVSVAGKYVKFIKK